MKVPSNRFEYLELRDEIGTYLETTILDYLRTSTPATDNWSYPSLISSRFSVVGVATTEEVEIDKLLPIQRSEKNADDICKLFDEQWLSLT